MVYQTAKLSVGGCFLPCVKQSKLWKTMEGFQVCPGSISVWWLCHLLWSLKEPELALVLAQVFPDLVCQKNKDAVSLEKQLVVGIKLIPLEKMANSLEIMWGGLVWWHQSSQVLVVCWFWDKIQELADAIASPLLGRRLVTIYICAVETQPFFALGLCASDCAGQNE